jgi:hypothetical protein
VVVVVVVVAATAVVVETVVKVTNHLKHCKNKISNGNYVQR